MLALALAILPPLHTAPRALPGRDQYPVHFAVEQGICTITICSVEYFKAARGVAKILAKCLYKLGGMFPLLKFFQYTNLSTYL